MQNGMDIVVFDEEQASYISSTDYTSARDIAGHHARLLAEHEGAALAAADTQNRLLETIRELEAAVIYQEAELRAARDVEERACIERDDAQRACALLQHQVALHSFRDTSTVYLYSRWHVDDSLTHTPLTALHMYKR